MNAELYLVPWIILTKTSTVSQQSKNHGSRFPNQSLSEFVLMSTMSSCHLFCYSLIDKILLNKNFSRGSLLRKTICTLSCSKYGCNKQLQYRARFCHCRSIYFETRSTVQLDFDSMFRWSFNWPSSACQKFFEHIVLKKIIVFYCCWTIPKINLQILKLFGKVRRTRKSFGGQTLVSRKQKIRLLKVE